MQAVTEAAEAVPQQQEGVEHAAEPASPPEQEVPIEELYLLKRIYLGAPEPTFDRHLLSSISEGEEEVNELGEGSERRLRCGRALTASEVDA